MNETRGATGPDHERPCVSCQGVPHVFSGKGGRLKDFNQESDVMRFFAVTLAVMREMD